MLFKSLITKIIFKQSRYIISLKHKYTSAVDVEKLDAESSCTHMNVIDDGSNNRERRLELRRNKSGLSPFNYNKFHENVPYIDPVHWSHNTLKYQQKMFGIYGESSGFDPSYCWPTQQELQCKINCEDVCDVYTIREAVQVAKLARKEREQQIWQRQKEMMIRIDKLTTWKHDLQSRISKKEKEAHDAKSRKDRLVEDVRRHFGYTIDPKSEKFKEMLDKKEKEQKKVLKEAKRKAKEEKMLGLITGEFEKHKENPNSKVCKINPIQE